MESEVAEKAYDSVAIILDGNYFYDSKKYLRSKKRTVRNLFHQLNSAKEKLMLIVKVMSRFMQCCWACCKDHT